MTQFATEHYDIQALVGGIGAEYRFARFVLFQLSCSVKDACAFLATVSNVTSVDDLCKSPPVVVNVALSFHGLKALGVNVQSLSTFPIEFREGMAARADANGDSDDGPNATGNWEHRWSTRSVDVLVAVYSRDQGGVIQRSNAIRSHATAHHVAFIYEQHAAHHLTNKKGIPPKRQSAVEHFGFVDGLSNPPVKGLSRYVEDGRINDKGQWEALAAGEFLFGYGDEAGELPIEPLPQSLARNGSFLVWRKLEQDVERFDLYVRDTASQLSMPSDELAELMVGRRRDGRSLALNSNSYRGFSYSIDSLGRGCPLGAHVRRANPRDNFGYQTSLVDRHRILRRGISYGTRWTRETTAHRRGLIFIAINISISRQFEFIQRQWLNFGNDFDQGNQRDPIVGSHDARGGAFVIPGDSERNTRVCTGIQTFVTTRGGDYFFLPGKRALQKLASSAFVRVPDEGHNMPI